MGQQLVKQPRRADDEVTPVIERCAWSWFYEVRVNVQPAGDRSWHWIGTTTEPPALVLGQRWARWKARRMMAAELRSQRWWR